MCWKIIGATRGRMGWVYQWVAGRCVLCQTGLQHREKGKWRIKGGRVRRKRRCLPLGLRQTIEALKGFSNVLS